MDETTRQEVDALHTAASHLVMLGASLKDVQEILGHADLKMTQRYAHLSPAHLRAAVDRLDGLTPAADGPTPATAWAHERTHKVEWDGACLVSPRAPVAQSDRARVS